MANQAKNKMFRMKRSLVIDVTVDSLAAYACRETRDTRLIAGNSSSSDFQGKRNSE
jgi:hypothetical protein